MDMIIAIAVIAGIVSSAVKAYSSRGDILYAPCSPFFDSPEGQEYMRRIREYEEQHNGETVPESVRRMIIDEALGRIR